MTIRTSDFVVVVVVVVVTALRLISRVNAGATRRVLIRRHFLFLYLSVIITGVRVVIPVCERSM